MTDYALSLNSENRVVAFLWHQGEHEAVENNPPEIFDRQLSEMFRDLRAKYGDIPFISGDFCRDWADRHLDVTMPIRKKIKAITERFDGLFVETDGLLSNDEVTANADIIHLSAQSQHVFGERYFAAFEKLLKENNKD